MPGVPGRLGLRGHGTLLNMPEEEARQRVMDLEEEIGGVRSDLEEARRALELRHEKSNRLRGLLARAQFYMVCLAMRIRRMNGNGMRI